jgi:hypothetical protein
MIGAVTSSTVTPVPFSRVGNTQAEHDHTPEGCTFCLPSTAKSSSSSPKEPGALTQEEQKQVEELKKRDHEVRIHEQAHLAAAGAYARGGPSFTYERGPDGKLYAVGGEVPIDLSAVADNPRATLQKAETIQRAALAPAEPSGPDRQVAAQAAALAAKARQELTQQSQVPKSQTIVGSPKIDATQRTPYHTDSAQMVHSETPTSPFMLFSHDAAFSSYSQQKQQHTVSSPGSLLNIAVWRFSIFFSGKVFAQQGKAERAL